MRLHEALNLHPHAAERRERSTGGTFSRCTALMPPEPSILRRVFDQPTRARDGPTPLAPAVLQGEVGFQVGDRALFVTSAPLVTKPRGVSHAF
jgi:hypothetical protein